MFMTKKIKFFLFFIWYSLAHYIIKNEITIFKCLWFGQLAGKLFFGLINAFFFLFKEYLLDFVFGERKCQIKKQERE